MMSILFGLGAASVLLFIVSAIFSVRQRAAGFSALQGLLLIAAVGLLAASTVLTPDSTVWVYGAGGVLLLAGVALIIIERRRELAPQRGMTGAGVAVLLLGAVFAMPYVQTALTRAAEQNAAVDLSTRVADARVAATNRANVPSLSSDASAVMPVSQVEPQQVPTRIPPQPTITPTPYTYEMPTPVPPICNGIVQSNLNFREAPELNADLIDVIPAGTVINIYERDDSGAWLRTTFQDRRGWVSASVVQVVDGGC